MTKTIELEEGKEIVVLPLRDGILTLICCDCGLTHDIEVGDYYHDGLEGITMKFHRNNRKTAWHRKQIMRRA